MGYYPMKWLKRIFHKASSRETEKAKKAFGKFPPENFSRAFMQEMHKHPEIVQFIEDSLREFGDNPVPKIIKNLVADGCREEAMVMGSIWLSYIGEAAIPQLIPLLGNDNYRLAMFAAKTLSGIEGSLSHIRKAMKSENPAIRLHAVGALQFFGPEAVEVMPDLSDFIKSEIIKSGKQETGNIPEAAGIAAGALGKIGETAIPVAADLLGSNNANIRLAGVAVLSRIGKSGISLLQEALKKERDQLLVKAIQGTINSL